MPTRPCTEVSRVKKEVNEGNPKSQPPPFADTTRNTSSFAVIRAGPWKAAAAESGGSYWMTKAASKGWPACDDSTVTNVHHPFGLVEMVTTRFHAKTGGG